MVKSFQVHRTQVHCFSSASVIQPFAVYPHLGLLCIESMANGAKNGAKIDSSLLKFGQAIDNS
jgi:hypothetical protein